MNNNLFLEAVEATEKAVSVAKSEYEMKMAYALGQLANALNNALNGTPSSNANE